MNKRDYSEIDDILDKIIMGKVSEDNFTDVLSGYTGDELMKELQTHEAAAVAIQRNAVLRQVSLVHNAYFKNRNKEAWTVRGNFRFWLSAAAILIVVPALIVMFLYATNSPDRLFASQYHTYRLNVDRTSSQSNKELLASNYQAGKYNEVITQFESLTSKSVGDKMIAAFAYMELNNYKAAIPLFNAVISNNIVTRENLYQDEAEYYLALSYLKAKQIEQSYQLFSKIYSDTEHTFNGRLNKWFIMRLKWLREQN